VKVLVIGGTGTIGGAVAQALSHRHDVIACGLTSGDVQADITEPDNIRDLFSGAGPVDAVVVTAGEATFKPLAEMTEEDYETGFRSKLMGQVNVVRLGEPHVRDNGSFTLTSGITSHEPMAGSTGFSMVNAAIEGFVRAAALELPRGIRINAVSPQWASQTLELYGMDPSMGLPPERLAAGYVESVEGKRTGLVIDAGWRYDGSDIVSVDAP
jgi:NAD(P)-dependent dehydrogenase (short-subunit alcohol dehydrogenase family)